MKIWLRFRLWLALRLGKDYIEVTSRQLCYLREMDIFIYGEDLQVYGLRVYLK